MFKIEMFPAGYGDCIWIEYGDVTDPNRILIDCGTLSTFNALKKRLTSIPASKRHFELFIITHIDTDHIDAAVKLLNAKSFGTKFDDVWFNEWKHLTHPDELGAIQGEFTATLLKTQNIPLNKAFKGESVVVPSIGLLPSVTLPGGMNLTLLSPGWPQLTSLRSVWAKELKRKGISPGDAKKVLKELTKSKKYADILGSSGPNILKLAGTKFNEDTSIPNGTSIAVLARFEGKSCLFAADAHPSVLCNSVDRFLLQNGAENLALTAFKVPHHGSKHNTNTDLLDKIQCKNFLFSTNGKRFSHPDSETVARIIIQKQPQPKLYFNYLSPFSKLWQNSALESKFNYKASFPAISQTGLILNL
jgi:beta-lactamase superfamily II metal-dependent hydrolase